VKCSICIATYDKAPLLQQTLASIFAQHPPFDFEVIVVDDGSEGHSTRDVCANFPVQYHRVNREHGFRNPCVARNVAYRAASGEIIIAQSDEVVHVTPNTIERLVTELRPGTFVIANVFCCNPSGGICGEYTGPSRQRPFFFLGSLYRKDLYAVGGNDEEFVIAPAYDDDWFGDCLIRGAKLQPVFSTAIVGHHLYHPIRNDLTIEWKTRDLYQNKRRSAQQGTGMWCSSGGPWPYVEPEMETESVFTSHYNTRAFGGTESVSGPGSSLTATAEVRKQLPGLLRQYSVKTLLDIPCGDYHWMRHVDLGIERYVGADIVRSLVENNQTLYGGHKCVFPHLNLLTSDLPTVDLVLCRDGMVHLSHADVALAVANLQRSGSTYLLATTFPHHQNTKTIRTGEWSPYNLQEPPFNFPPPLALLNEHCSEYYPQYSDKSLGLWKIADLGKPSINSITVCVDYDDFLEITLPRNKQHFQKTLVVTSTTDKRAQALCDNLGCICHITDAFYRNGAAFNKGAAMEEGFDVLGRNGWICVWDADIVMPSDIHIPNMQQECLYGPARRILTDPRDFTDTLDWATLPSPTLPHEYDGFFQLFHASAVPQRPWYSIDWVHAGGCDSDFQALFPIANRKRTAFNVLHLGPEGIAEIGTRVGRNWRGRTTPRIDTGAVSNLAQLRNAEILGMVADRKLFGTARERLS
jgi:hypothetical protein